MRWVIFGIRLVSFVMGIYIWGWLSWWSAKTLYNALPDENRRYKDLKWSEIIRVVLATMFLGVNIFGFLCIVAWAWQ